MKPQHRGGCQLPLLSPACFAVFLTLDSFLSCCPADTEHVVSMWIREGIFLLNRLRAGICVDTAYVKFNRTKPQFFIMEDISQSRGDSIFTPTMYPSIITSKTYQHCFISGFPQHSSLTLHDGHWNILKETPPPKKRKPQIWFNLTRKHFSRYTQQLTMESLLHFVRLIIMPLHHLIPSPC